MGLPFLPLIMFITPGKGSSAILDVFSFVLFPEHIQHAQNGAMLDMFGFLFDALKT